MPINLLDTLMRNFFSHFHPQQLSLFGNIIKPLPLPEGVNTHNDIQNDSGYNSLNWCDSNPVGVNHISFIPYLIKSNQEQQEEINADKARIATLESQVTDLLARVSSLESA